MKKRPIINRKECVACGCCQKICPMTAISIPNGIYAQIDYSKCVGCSKCVGTCPANVITMEDYHEEKMV